MKLPLASFATILILTALLTGAARAGSVGLIVTDKDGRPVPDVVVLVDPALKVAAHATSAAVVIAQENLHFVPFLSVVAVGTTLRFTNRDTYDHHVRSTPSGPIGSIPPVVDFEVRLDGLDGLDATSGKKRRLPSNADVTVDKPGAIGLGCHLHSSMRGQVYVSATPWFAKTDANGAVVIEGVPNGAAEVTLWHADQFQDQTVLKLVVSENPSRTTAQLNFTPRRRRG